jgi:hypothetical protein
LTPTVLITGARAPVAQDLARACRAAGYRVHLTDSSPSYAARTLRPRFPVHRLPPPAQAFDAFREAMRALIDQIEVSHVLPTCEEVFWLAEAAARDGYTARLFAPDVPLLRTLHSKYTFARFAAALGIAVPETEIRHGPIAPESLPFALDACVLKPEYSRFATHTLVAPTRAQLARIHPHAGCGWVVQRRVQGEELCSWAALHRGEVTAFAAYRPRWRHGRAAAFQLEAAAAPQARAMTACIGAATGMTGHLSLDLIVDEKGVMRPIECNPRAVSGLHLFDAGAEMARAIIEARPCAEPSPGLLRHMAPAMALLGMPAALTSGRLSAFLKDWRASSDVINRERQVRMPLACLADAAGFAVHAVRARRSPAGATTADIEWNGEPFA